MRGIHVGLTLLTFGTALAFAVPAHADDDDDDDCCRPACNGGYGTWRGHRHGGAVYTTGYAAPTYGSTCCGTGYAAAPVYASQGGYGSNCCTAGGASGPVYGQGQVYSQGQVINGYGSGHVQGTARGTINSGTRAAESIAPPPPPAQ
jgi:hypothetical protein